MWLDRIPRALSAALLLSCGQTDTDEPRLDPPEHGVQLEVTARALPPGTEETLCHYMKLPSDADMDVNRVVVSVSGGSHHIHLYRPYRAEVVREDGFEECNMAVDFDVWELMVVTQLPQLDWTLPEGVAIRMRAGEQLLMQTHFVNVGLLETSGEGIVKMNLHAVDPSTIQAHAGSLFGQDKTVLVPPQSEVTASSKCVFPQPISLIAQSGHYHFRGRRFSTYRWQDARGEELYHHEGYSDPLFQVQADPLRFEAGEGLEWECQWSNETDDTFEFGPYTDANEHCNLFGFYYPARAIDEAITCVKSADGERTTVRSSHLLSE